MNKFYMVLGIKHVPIPDKETERDNPYVFNSLRSAFQFAEKVNNEDGYVYVAEVKIIEALEAIEDSYKINS